MGESLERAYDHLKLAQRGKKTTNPHWTHKIQQMVNSNIIPTIEIIIDSLTWDEAEDAEAALIKFYGRRDYDVNGCLYNACKRSHHWEGYKHTEESKAKMRAAAANRKPISDETRMRISLAGKGKKRPPRDQTWKDKQRAAHIGRSDPKTAYANKSKAQSGANNPRSKRWLLQREDGTIFEVHSLRTWCNENAVRETALKGTRGKNKFSQGYKILG